jgi:hypothetical protein
MPPKNSFISSLGKPGFSSAAPLQSELLHGREKTPAHLRNAGQAENSGYIEPRRQFAPY